MLHFLNKKNPICAILWQDAAFSYEDNPPSEIPNPRLTVGYIIETTEEYTFISTNIDYDIKNKKIIPIDGFVIPRSLIINFKKIGYYE